MSYHHQQVTVAAIQQSFHKTQVKKVMARTQNLVCLQEELLVHSEMFGWEETGRQNTHWPSSGHNPSLETLPTAQDVTSIAHKLPAPGTLQCVTVL